MSLYVGNKSKGMVNDMRDYTYQKHQRLGQLAEYVDTLASFRPSWCGHACPAGTFILLQNKEEYEPSIRALRAEIALHGNETVEQRIRRKAEEALWEKHNAEKWTRLAAEFPERYYRSGKRIRVKRVR